MAKCLHSFESVFRSIKWYVYDLFTNYMFYLNIFPTRYTSKFYISNVGDCNNWQTKGTYVFNNGFFMRSIV